MAVIPQLFSCRMPVNSLQGILNTFQARLKYLYLESEATIDLIAYAPFQSSWTHGRAFGEDMELRWDRDEQFYDLLLLTESSLSLTSEWQPVAVDLSVEPGQVLLWGTHVSHLDQHHRLAETEGNAWIETRIPRALTYPVAGSPRWVKANVIIYRQQGQPCLTRLVSLEGEEHEPRL